MDIGDRNELIIRRRCLMHPCVFTLLLSRWEATLQSIMSESSWTDQFTLCLVIIFKALWSASSCAGIRFFGSWWHRSPKTHQSVSCQISPCHYLFVAMVYLSFSCEEPWQPPFCSSSSSDPFLQPHAGSWMQVRYPAVSRTQKASNTWCKTKRTQKI